MKRLSLMMMLLILPACAGEFDMFTNGAESSDGWGSPSPNAPHNPDAPSIVDPNIDTEELTPGFTLQREEVRLLPFHIRLAKLATLTGLATDDPLFDRLLSSRYDLGDHNYGQNVGPDLSWNASKIALWVRAIQPICTSEAMAMRYDLPQDTSALLAAAYGRSPEADELVDFEAVQQQNLDEAGQYEAICLAVLTSSEFVAQ